MKLRFKLLLTLGLLLGAFSLYAAKGPIEPWISKIRGDVTINANNGVSSIAAGSIVEADAAAYDSDGQLFERVLRVTYDVSTDGGTAGTYDLGQDLPAGALMTGSYIYIDTAFVDGGAGTVALHCEDADNILAAVDLTPNATGAVINGVATASSGVTVSSISAACDVIATVAGSNQTAGKLILFLRYFEHD